MSKKDVNKLGFGVLINMMGGNEETIEALDVSLGEEIKSIALKDNKLRFSLPDWNLIVWDDGQSCCEHRYMTCDDDLGLFSGAKLMEFRVQDAPPSTSEYGDEHEVQFLIVKTSKGEFTCETHNEHNGYYSGFWMVARLEK